MRSISFALPLALVATVATFGLSAGPAMASPEACAAAPAALTTLANKATGDAQRIALSNISLGQKLCEADARFEASKKFKVAAKALGTDLAAVMNGTATAAAAE
ncbi:hypothetical protein [Sandaracinobacteroides saxicola]|uniref:Uncharacterized protein n=1 Tax=Sandaracinobacteroides saxicola TaxID=2759707 RepID=A0A7G5IGQ6_9SPHN|nr:hypothetical protein [Sandaracinobacteroides saxicola]QMW22548.1 hypothetical protein H3309_14675 [Sandaracinobacteroides saxicola]